MPTNQLPLTLQNLEMLDQGKIAVAFNQALRAARMDIQDRPGDPAKRKVVFTVEMEPKLEKETAQLDLIDHRFHVETKLPKRSTVAYPIQPAGEGDGYFRPESPNDPRQFDLYTGPQTPSDDAAPAAGDGENFEAG